MSRDSLKQYATKRIIILIGISALVIATASVLVLKLSGPSFVRLALAALCVGFVALLVAYQSTTALWLGFTWVYLDLIRAGTLILQHENQMR